jgi:NADPH:quinone reductase-like Zn-dependent oxidoreductase
MLLQSWRWKTIALFQSLPGKHLGLALPGEGKGNNELLLIYGWYTNFGCLGIQFAKLAGYKVIVTRSPRHNEPVKSGGADEVFDYNDPQWPAKVRKLTENKPKNIWDTIYEADKYYEALSSEDEMSFLEYFVE